VRETADAVVTLKKNEVSLGELAAKLVLDKSVTSRRVRDATNEAISSTMRPAEVGRRGSSLAIRCRKW